MRVLMLGDVFGRPGRQAVQYRLPKLRTDLQPDAVVANGENAAGGFGLTSAVAKELFSAGVDVLTTGNHVWDQKELLPHLDADSRLVRPLNYPIGSPGRGVTTFVTKAGEPLTVVNLAGRLFMSAIDCPFQALDAALDELDEGGHAILVDFHAEATAEKGALAWYADGRVSAVVGTHTHVPTADARVLPGGTAFVSDAGMIGPYNSIIGSRPATVVQHFRTRLPARFEVGEGPAVFNSVLIEIGQDGKAVSIERHDFVLEPLAAGR